jgi:hypothetical protein
MLHACFKHMAHISKQYELMNTSQNDRIGSKHVTWIKLVASSCLTMDKRMASGFKLLHHLHFSNPKFST